MNYDGAGVRNCIQTIYRLYSQWLALHGLLGTGVHEGDT